jgi:putative transcriptional regulator
MGRSRAAKVTPQSRQNPTPAASRFVWLGAVILLLAPRPVALLRAGAPAASGGAAAQLQPGAVRALAPGKLLVAGRDLADPNFAEAVVLLADFDKRGATGLIVNRRTKTTLASVLPDLKKGQGASTLVFFGGPVEAPGVLALLRSEGTPANSRHVVGDVYLITTRALLDKTIAAGTGPDRFRVYVGYAGWAPGQLESETAHGAWQVLDGDAKLVFDPDPGSLWQRKIPPAGGRMASRPDPVGARPVSALPRPARSPST